MKTDCHELISENEEKVFAKQFLSSLSLSLSLSFKETKNCPLCLWRAMNKPSKTGPLYVPVGQVLPS